MEKFGFLKKNNQEAKKEKPYEYKFFDYSKERKQLYEYCSYVADYLRHENIPNLVIIDRSSRPLYIGVREYWKAKYGEKGMPNVYFLNPKGFKASEDLTNEDIAEIAIDTMFKDDAEESSNQIRSREEIIKEFKETYKKLIADKEKPVLVFDSCIHSGDTLSPVKSVMKKTGFKDVRIGSINPSDKKSQVKTDFYITPVEPEKGCYPFDRDRMIEKTFDHVYSKPADDENKREKSIDLRHEISKIIHDQIETDPSLRQEDSGRSPEHR